MNPRHILRTLFMAGVDAVAPGAALLRHVEVRENRLHANGCSCPLDRGVLVVGAGKGVAPMAQALEQLLADWPLEGLVITKYDHGVPLERIAQLEAAHPVPNEAGQAGTEQMLDLVSVWAGRRPVLALFTGGASALTPAPVQGLTLRDLQETTRLMLACGATIHEMNAVRKHLSAFAGGQLARMAAPSPVLAFLVSDVVGDQPDVIASGPTVPDVSTFAMCRKLLRGYGLEDRLPAAVMRRLDDGCAGRALETPKPGDAVFSRGGHVLVASNAQALDAVVSGAESCGVRPRLLEQPLQGEARQVAHNLVREALTLRAMLAPGDAPLCLVAGGETTVTLKGEGLGGRNQEMALAAALALEELDRDGIGGVDALFGGTDGTDGPTEAAGGFALADSARRMREAGVDPVRLLEQNDSHAALAAVGDLLVTGPTRTNVMDIALVLVHPPRG